MLLRGWCEGTVEGAAAWEYIGKHDNGQDTGLGADWSQWWGQAR